MPFRWHPQIILIKSTDHQLTKPSNQNNIVLMGLELERKALGIMKTIYQFMITNLIIGTLQNIKISNFV